MRVGKAEKSHYRQLFSSVSGWLFFAFALFFVVGAVIFHQWWKSFLMGGGFMRSLHEPLLREGRVLGIRRNAATP